MKFNSNKKKKVKVVFVFADLVFVSGNLVIKYHQLKYV